MLIVFFFSFFFFLPPTPRLFVIFLPSLSTDEHRFFLEQSLRFPSNFRRNSIPSRLLHAHFFPPVIYLYHRRTMILFTLIYPRCSFASPPSFSTASPIRSTVFTLLYYSILFRSSIFILLLIYLFYPFIYFSLPLPSLLCLFRCECTSDEGERASEERETRSRQERALSICSLTSPPRSNVRLFSVIIFLIIIATILFFVNVIVVLQHSLSPIFPCCRTRRRRKGDEFRST